MKINGQHVTLLKSAEILDTQLRLSVKAKIKHNRLKMSFYLELFTLKYIGFEFISLDGKNSLFTKSHPRVVVPNINLPTN